MTKACVADVRSVGGMSNSCSLEGRDGEGREGRQKTMAGGREAVARCRSQEPPPFEVGARAKRLREEPPNAWVEPGSELPK